MERYSINKCDFIILLWAIYQLQEVLYAPGAISSLIGVTIIFLGLIATFKYTKKSEHNSFMNSALFLLLIFIIYGLLRIFVGNDGYLMSPPYTYLQFALLSFTPIFLFSNYAENGLITEEKLRVYFVVFFVVSISGYYKYFNQQLLLNDTIEQGGITNNSGYLFLNVLPYLFLFKKPILRYFLLAVTLICIVMCMKRGAIIIAIVCAIYLIWRSYKAALRIPHKLIIIVAAILCTYIVITYISLSMQTNDFFVLRLEQTKNGESSDRDIIYSGIWNVIRQGGFFHWIFGHGAYSTVAIYGKMAHQDWLEVMCNNGLIGVVAMLGFFKSFWKRTKLLKIYRSKDNPCYDMLFLAFVIIFLKTMFSMSIMDIPVSLSILIGYCMQNSNNRVQNKQELMQ